MSELEQQPSPNEADDLAKALREVLNLASGRRVIFWLLEQAAIYRDPFCGSEDNATNYTLGQQSIARRLIAEMDAVDPRAYPALLLARAEDKAMARATAVRPAADTENDDAED